MKTVIAAAGFALLAACATSKAPDGDRAVSTALAAPTPADVATKITGASNGESVNVKRGTKIAVELVGVPTAGYIWKIAAKPDFLEAAGEYGGPTSSDQLQPGFAGGNHWEAFVFDVTGTGAGALVFEQRRPWEDESVAADSAFSVTVVSGE